MTIPAARPTRSRLGITRACVRAIVVPTILALCVQLVATVESAAQVDPTAEAAAVEAMEQPAPVRSSGPLIAYTSPAFVTVTGSWESLQAVVEELCEQAGIELEEYRAPDRPVRVEYFDMPLSTVLERLLREENYMVGFGSAVRPNGTRTSWLRVIGSRDGRTIDSSVSGSAPASAPVQGGVPGTLMAEFPVDALSMADDATRNEMVATFASLLDDDRTVRGRFLSTPDGQLGDALSKAEYGQQFAVRLRATVRDAAIRGKISRVINRLRW